MRLPKALQLPRLNGSSHPGQADMGTSVSNHGAAKTIPLRGWFAQTSEDFPRDLLALGRAKSCVAGETLYRAGDSSDDYYGVIRGVILLQGHFPHPDAVMFHMLHPGDWVGSVPVLANRVRYATASARTEAELLLIPGVELRALLRRKPQHALELSMDLAYHLDVALQVATDLLIRDSEARCAAALLRLGGCRRTGDHGTIASAEVPASQAELAMLTNTSRNTLNGVLGRFAEKGLITLSYRAVRIDDPVRLRQIADGG